MARSGQPGLLRPCAAALLAATLCLSAPHARADVRAGLASFEQGAFSGAYEAWRDAAAAGDPAAALYLGVLFDTGTGVAQDHRAALDWYRRAAEGGNKTAMFNLGVMFDAGVGTEPQPAAAVRWYERAAAAGSGRAEYNMALMFEGGLGVAPDRARAVRLYRAAASHGVAAAGQHLRQLGYVFGGGTHRPQEDPAMVAFQQAQQVLLRRGAGQAQEAVLLFRRAAETGDALAAYNLAYCYEHGIGVSSDVEQAMVWYRRSAAGARDADVRQLADAAARTLGAAQHARR